jgi:CubicO group peptidase (beta-lactamase class C family)
MKIRAMASLLFAVALPLPLVAQTPLPDTPAAKRLAGWLEAFNSGDRGKITAFWQANDPDRVKLVDGALEFREMTGGFTIKKVEECGETKCVALMQEKKSDQFGRATMEVQPNPPFLVKDFSVRAMDTPAEFALPRMTEKEVVAATLTKAEQASAADEFSGAVIVAKNGKPIFSGAYGMADRAKKIPNTLETKFRIGSMNKMFTATATMQLVQEGKIEFEKPFGTYLADYPNKEMASSVTIHQLLTHTGGTGDIFGPDFEKNRLELKTLQDYVKLYGVRGVKFPPGTKWEYSNYGFLLLGVIVQRVSGQDYYDYVREHIFKPAGMGSTDSLPEDVAVANRSVGYMKEDPSKGWQPNTETLPYRGTSAGGGYSTVGDLLAFANALESYRLLDEKYTNLLVAGKVETPGGNGRKYAYGFMESVSPDGVTCFGHGGGAPGMNGQLTICKGSRYTVAVLANLDPPAASRVADFIVSRLPKE